MRTSAYNMPVLYTRIHVRVRLAYIDIRHSTRTCVRVNMNLNVVLYAVLHAKICSRTIGICYYKPSSLREHVFAYMAYRTICRYLREYMFAYKWHIISQCFVREHVFASYRKSVDIGICLRILILRILILMFLFFFLFL